MAAAAARVSASQVEHYVSVDMSSKMAAAARMTARQSRDHAAISDTPICCTNVIF
jgi:hypothetical protein